MGGVQFGGGGGEISVNGEDGENVCPHFLQPFLENIDRRSCNEKKQQNQKSRPSPPALTRTLAYLVGVPSKAAMSGRETKQVWINVQETREYLGCGNQVDMKPSPLQGMEA